MAKEERVYVPSGMGGLLRFGEEEESKFKIKPKRMVYVVVGIVAFELAVRLFI